MNIETIKGKWWLQSNSKIKYNGELEISEESIHLKINTLNEKFPHENFDLETILGESEYGMKITLYDLKTRDAIIQSNIWANYAIFGDHFKDKSELNLSLISFYFSDFAEWINKNVFSEIKIEHDELKLTVDGYSFKKKFNEFELEIKYSPNFSIKGVSSLQIGNNPLLILTSKNAIGLDDFIAIIWSLQDFFTLISGEVLYPYGFRAMNLKMKNSEISIIYQGQKERRTKKNFEYVIPFQTIEENLDLYLKNWFDKVLELKTISDLFLEPIYKNDIVIEFKLLIYTQIIEAYHRRFYNGEFMAAELFEPIKNHLILNIPKVLDSEFERSLESRINYGYQFTLKKRLHDICNDYYDVFFISFIKDRSLFINNVKDTRDFRTHLSKKKKKHVVEDEQLVLLNLQLQLICHILLLIEIEIPDEIIQNFIKYSITKSRIDYLSKETKVK